MVGKFSVIVIVLFLSVVVLMEGSFSDLIMLLAVYNIFVVDFF